MGQKKDIGEIFASKLKEGQRNPSSELWNKVDNSLQRQNELKKRNLSFWFIGGAIALIFVISILFSYDIISTKSSTSNNKPAPEGHINLPVNENHYDGGDQINIQDSMFVVKNKTRVAQDILDSSEKSKKKIEQESSKHTKPRSPEEKNSKIKDAKFDEDSFDVVRKYHYYSSDDGVMHVTEKINVIDSLVNRNPHEIDTVQKK